MAERDLAALPKTDLHVHLEGSIRGATLAEIADANGVAAPPGIAGGRWSFLDFDDFIAQWMASQACLVRLEDFRRIAVEFCDDQAAQGVRYAEVHLSLPEHGIRLGDRDGPLEAVLDGFGAGERATGSRCRVVLDVVRGLGIEPSRRGMEAGVRFAGRGVVAVGLGGSERHPPEDYAAIFAEAREAGLRSVPHAGETMGPARIRSAVEALGADRIGHGIRVLEDPRLIEDLVERGVALDVCPTSNVMTRVVGSMEEHPLPQLLEAGLTVTLNSDDPAMFSSPVAGEYEAARRAFELSDQDLAGLARMGVRASFADDGLKREIERGIDAWLADASPDPNGSR